MKVTAAIQYTKIKQLGIGQGMNSEVFLAHDPQLGGDIVVKEIEKAKLVNTLPAFFAEAQAMFAVSHSNVVPIYYACETSTHVCLGMPYFPAGSLASRIEKGPLSLGGVVTLGHGVLTGAAQVHMKGYLHFDIKPTNILYTSTALPMLADFGQARRLTAAGVVQMPPMYPAAIPPETLLTGTGSVASDVYQIGLLLYRAANGDDFYQAQKPADPALHRKRVVKGLFPDRTRFMPHVPRKLRTLIRKALKTDPSDRYQAAIDVQDALAKVDFELDWTSTPTPTGEISWLAPRADGTELSVHLLQQGALWRTEVYTEGTTRRAKGKATFWKVGFSRDDAFAHLKDVFEELG